MYIFIADHDDFYHLTCGKEDLALLICVLHDVGFIFSGIKLSIK